MKMFEKKWVDLGLPNGTLWCDANEEGYYSWNEMMEKFNEENLPKLTDFAELYDYCSWKWDDEKKGVWVIGINGNHIFMPALGIRVSDNGNLGDVGINGNYWSTSPTGCNAYHLYFSYSGYVSPSSNYNREKGMLIRLIKRTK